MCILDESDGGAGKAGSHGCQDIVKVFLISLRILAHLEETTCTISKLRLALWDVGVLEIILSTHQAAPTADLVVSPIVSKVVNEMVEMKKLLSPPWAVFLYLL